MAAFFWMLIPNNELSFFPRPRLASATTTMATEHGSRRCHYCILETSMEV